jgi:hypothetical protein
MRLVALPPRKQEAESLGFDYSRFIILSGPRTGSNLLAQALGSNPSILCFREIFNVTHDFVQYDVDGYDNFDRRDFLQRQRRPAIFLDARVFCPHPSDILAVGFKFHYGQLWGFPGIIERLIEDEALHVIHLRRKNSLRALVSLKLAQRSGSFMLDTARKPAIARLLFATRHPLRVAKRFKRALMPAGEKIVITPDELSSFIIKTIETSKHYDELFHRHQTLHVVYEELSEDKKSVSDQAARFVGARPSPPVVTLRRQNPQPLYDLIENYDELRTAFVGSPHEDLFEEPGVIRHPSLQFDHRYTTSGDG